MEERRLLTSGAGHLDTPSFGLEKAAETPPCPGLCPAWLEATQSRTGPRNSKLPSAFLAKIVGALGIAGVLLSGRGA